MVLDTGLDGNLHRVGSRSKISQKMTKDPLSRPWQLSPMQKRQPKRLDRDGGNQHRFYAQQLLKRSRADHHVTVNMQTAHDIPLRITSEDSASERRITPSWSIAHLKTKLEPVTGIPPSSQRLSLRLPNQAGVAIEAADEENVQLAAFPLQAYAEIHVCKSLFLSWLPNVV